MKFGVASLQEEYKNERNWECPPCYFKFDWNWKTGLNIAIGRRVFIGPSLKCLVK